MSDFQHLEGLFRHASGDTALSRLLPGEVLANAMQDYFHHYGLEALLLDTSEVHAGFIDRGALRCGAKCGAPRSRWALPLWYMAISIIWGYIAICLNACWLRGGEWCCGIFPATAFPAVRGRQ